MRPFEEEVAGRIAANGADEGLKRAAAGFMEASIPAKYSYNFRWMGRPIIQYPQDIVATQELIYSVQPDLIIETGIAHGGSIIFSASMLELNAACGGPADAKVVAVDIEIREHNRKAIEAHPMARRIRMIEGSSIAPEVVGQVRIEAEGRRRVMVLLDSNHTHEHVLAELRAFAPLVTKDSYCVVFDTVVEDLPAEFSSDRPWAPGDNPRTAVNEYLKETDAFEVDRGLDDKILISVAGGGYLRRIR
ncbi:cephalosporin hydroxylase family protein [Haloferula sp. A504]|uniref:cephalosporin hydroxylase family protein n=1 Tax=Haloferula sp. A504 TaxID=3373601 RepID=UPI0031C2089E|nr:cephalosporin hydroxylase family protein [Verrucomicrobiaceae bacterium E54]